jgi:hypothetical protein
MRSLNWRSVSHIKSDQPRGTNMQSTVEDARALFRKWQEEKVFVSVVLKAGKIIASADACIMVSDDSLTLKAANFENSPEHHFLLQVPFDEIEHYEYFTPRDFTPSDPEVPDDEQEGWILGTYSGVTIELFY